MKRIMIIGAATLLLASCAPVLNSELMGEGTRNASLDELKANPDAHKGKLFILGGLIVETRFAEKGSQVEVLSVPVDSRGYPEESEGTDGRFLALLPKEKGLLDPLVFKKGREISLAGTFIETRKAKIDEMEYVYPVFEIRQIILFKEAYYYEYPYYPHYGYPYPYGYGPPWWGPWPPPPGWW